MIHASRALLGVVLVIGCGDNLPGPPVPSDESTLKLLEVGSPASEGGLFTITARRSGDARGEVSVTYATQDATAIAGEDYTATTGTLLWGDGDAVDKSFTVRVLTDLVTESTETFSVALSNPIGDVTLAAPSALTLLITDGSSSGGGDAVVVTDAGNIITFDRGDVTAPTTIAVLALPAGETFHAIDFRPADGNLYALTTRDLVTLGGPQVVAKLYTVDPVTGVMTNVTTLTADPADTTDPFLSVFGTRFGIDFNPVVDRLRVVSDTGQNLRVNVMTGATITDADIIGASSGYANVAYTNAFAAACRTTLFAIDTASDTLVVQNPPNNGVTTAVGALGLDATAVAGFDVVTDGAGGNTALAFLGVGAATALHSIDLATGVASAIGVVDTDGGVPIAFAVEPGGQTPPQAAGELFGATETGRLVSFNRAAPAKFCTDTAFTGLASGDSVVGIDFRPSTGVLHALTNNLGVGKLYTVDPSTAAVSGAVTLTQALTGAEFGMDFNPTGPVALRIVSDSGQNLRVTDVAAGTTTVDTALNGAATAATGAAYTDAVPNAGTTTLYVVDEAADRLRIQNPPNAGTLVDVGALGIDVGASNGFDIDGRDNTAFVTAGAGAAMTTLHTIDLVTGVASASLGILPVRLRGLTRPTPTTTVFGITAANALVTVSVADPSMVTTIGTVTNLQTSEQILGIDFRPNTGILYGLGSSGRIYSIDPATAAGTVVSTLAADPADLTAPFTALAGTEFGMDFNPTGAVALRVISNVEENLRIPNVLVGLVNTDTNLTRAARTYAISAIAYANNSLASPATTLFAIDATSDKLVAINPPNTGVVREIGPLGFDADAVSSFDIIFADTAIAVLQGAGTRTLVTINLVTGAATTVSTFGGSAQIRAIAAPISAAAPAINSIVFALDDAGNLLSFERNAPGNLTLVGALTGLGLTETAIAMDFRPSTNELWVLTRDLLGGGRLYTVNTATAAATLRSTLSADSTDMTDPYLVLPAGEIGMDFNPTNLVALRLVASNGVNLRVADPLAGNVFSDTPIGQPAPDALAAAYTNSFAAATGATIATTTLFVIDAATGSLVIQNPPNNGTLTPVGALSPSLAFGGVSGFDIGGGNNGVVLAALQRLNGNVLETISRLYRVSLTTGQATEVGTGTGISGPPLRGLAVRIR